MKNSFCWLQLQTPNSEEMKTFYASLFDWKLTESPDKDYSYTHIDTGEGPGGGIMSGKQGAPSHWMPYVQVADLAHYTKKAEQLGAKVIAPATQINNGGSFSVIQDPSGALIGLYQPHS